MAERRRLLRYLEKENNQSFADLVKKLKLKIVKNEEEVEEQVLETLAKTDEMTAEPEMAEVKT